jgi:hypothetical protein
MGIRALIFPTCKELARSLSSGAYESASWPARLAVRWHLARCELCRIYARQVELLADGYRRSRAQSAAPSGLKARLAARLRRKGD